jgi:N-methylhydantoinase B
VAQGVDPLSLQVFANLFSSIAEQMGATLQRASFSPNIKMRRDFSCALFDADGELLAQAAHIPVHLGAMPLAMQAVRERFSLQPGDAVIMNDPYTGGTHLPDISLVSAAFTTHGERLGYVMSRAHHADIGGMSPGSMPLSTEIYQEGVIIPPILLTERGRLNVALFELILRNVRTPEERRGDFDAQLSAQRVGESGMAELADAYGIETIAAHGHALQAYSEATMRSFIERIPPGAYDFTDRLDDDGQSDEPVPIHARVTRRAESSDLDIDFAGSASQREGSINAVRAVTMSATLYVMRCLLGEDVPVNQGSIAPLRVHTPAGSVVAAERPGAVAGGNVETSQRIVDVLFGALAQALPDGAPAASQGTMNNLALGGFDSARDQPFAYYETLGGGMGGRPTVDGLSGAHDHMSNTLNTPIEALESELPLRVTRYELRRGTGGVGRHHGGEGVRRDVQFLEPTTVTILSERRRFAPYGLAGGGSGARGENVLERVDGELHVSPKATFRTSPGDVLSIRTPGGGGWGGLPLNGGR